MDSYYRHGSSSEHYIGNGPDSTLSPPPNSYYGGRHCKAEVKYCLTGRKNNGINQ